MIDDCFQRYVTVHSSLISILDFLLAANCGSCFYCSSRYDSKLLKHETNCCRYFRDFHLQLPILDPSVFPDDLYGNSPLLFWVVLSIGSRGYEKHPSLIHALSPRVTNDVMMLMNRRNITVEIIKALILFLTWPFPSTSFYQASTFVHGAALLHIAMQCELHTPYFDIEYSKTDLDASEMDSLERAKLWAYTVIIYQRYCIPLATYSYLY
jgi:hypothetical protein